MNEMTQVNEMKPLSRLPWLYQTWPGDGERHGVALRGWLLPNPTT